MRDNFTAHGYDGRFLPFVAAYEYQYSSTIDDNCLEFNNPAIKPILFALTEDISLRQVCVGFKLHADPMAGLVKYLSGYINPDKIIGIPETDTFRNVNTAQQTLKAVVRLFAM